MPTVHYLVHPSRLGGSFLMVNQTSHQNIKLTKCFNTISIQSKILPKLFFRCMLCRGRRAKRGTPSCV